MESYFSKFQLTCLLKREIVKHNRGIILIILYVNNSKHFHVSSELQCVNV